MTALDRKTSISILALFCLIISFQPITLSETSYWVVYPGWKFIPTDKGAVSFNSKAYFNGIQFQNGYALFSSLRFPGGYSWSSIGFQCSNNGNITILKTDEKEIQYIVNAPFGQTSTTRLRLSHLVKPSSVTGAFSWGHSGNIVTIRVLHLSPANITIEWEDYSFSAQKIFESSQEGFQIMSLSIIIFAVLLLFLAFRQGSISMMAFILLVEVAIVLILCSLTMANVEKAIT